MKKIRNKIVLVLLALCLAVCAGLFVACGGDTPKDNSVTYTVTVMAGNAAAEGVQVTVKKGSATLGTPKATGSDGKAEFKLAEDAGYTVTLNDLPRGYKLADGAELKFDSNRKLTVTLEEKPVSYTVKLVNPDNTAYTAAGVLVGICTVEGNNCLELVEPDANGTVKIYDAEKTNYHIQVKGLPAGYAFESDGTYALHQNAGGTYLDAQLNKEYVSLSDTVVEQTIKIYPVNVITLTDASKLSDADLQGDYSYVEGLAAYKMNIEVAANTTVYYEYTADYSGDYNFYSDAELVCKLNESFLLGDNYLSGNGGFYPPITMEKGKKYYLNVTNNGEEKATAEAILATPYATNDTVTGGTVKAEVNKQGKNAAIVLEPTAGSTYKLTVNGNGAIKQATSSYMVEYVEFEEADYTNSKELTVKYTEDMQGNLYFAVSVKANTYPASADVKIEKIGTHTNETAVVKSTVFAQAPAKPEGKELAPVASAETLVKGDDGYYHMGSKDGELVMVALTKAFGVNSDGIIYMERWNHQSSSAYVIDVTSVEDQANANKGKSFKDYRLVLRGFNEFNVQQEGLISYKYIIPTDLEEDTYYYANYVNEDGAYPLDDLLKDFLTGFADTLGTDWLFACGYYDVPQDDDPIVGEYSTEDGAFTLTIYNNNQFVIMDVGEGIEYASGTWRKTGNEYTFIIPNDYFDSVMAYADGEITFSDNIFNEDPLTFAKAEQSGDDENEEDDGEPDFADLYSTQTWDLDPTISLARLGLYKDDKCVLWQYRGSAYVKIATATWGAEEDGSNVTITNITAADGVDYEIEAEYNMPIVTVTLKMEDMDDMVYTFNMAQQA